jgi:hypothetical protein
VATGGEACDTAPVPEISPRLLQRIETEFPHHVDVVREHLHALGPLVDHSRQDPERMYGAVVRVAEGRLDGLERALDLARSDWRDLLMAADLGEADWPGRLSGWLDPAKPTATAGPATQGELVEADGRRWVVRRRRIDPRLVKRLIRRTDVVVILGESGGSRPRRLVDAERTAIWEKVRGAYAGRASPGPSVDGSDYQGYEFVDDDGAVMLYLEERR